MSIETRWYTGFGSGGSTEECFNVPAGWANVIIRYWHTPNQEWVDLATEFKTVDGVKKACADIPANGWIALQGMELGGKLPEHDHNACYGECPEVQTPTNVLNKSSSSARFTP